jgi:hypothetical protein
MPPPIAVSGAVARRLDTGAIRILRLPYKVAACSAR